MAPAHPPARLAADLSGVWRAAPGDDDLRRRFADDGFDDGAWAEVTVPGHWRSAPGLETADGPVLHRRRFEAHAPLAGSRAFLVLEGCFSQADVWLDGSYLGDTEAPFLPHAFEVTEQLSARDEHVLGVELACAPVGEAAPPLLGGFDPDWNPGGIWRPVRLVETGPVRISALRVCCTDATTGLARLHLTAVLDAATAGEVELRTTVGPADPATPGSRAEHVQVTRLTAGANQVHWHLDVAEPALWWPRALDPTGGSPALVDVEVQASVPSPPGADRAAAALSDRAVRRTGLRQVRMQGWVLEVNGERLFVKGSSVGPTRRSLGETPAAEVEADVALAQEAGLDLLRVRAHIARPELYEAADRAGLLLWQDLPLPQGVAGAVGGEAVERAAAAVDLLAHHPSIALWSGPGEPADPAFRAARFLRRQVLPPWKGTVLDAALARVLEGADGSQAATAGVVPHPAWTSDAHAWLGWYRGHERDLPAWLRRVPVLGRFVGAFGAQAVPGTAAWMEPERWPDLDWDRLERRHGLQKEVFDRRVPPAAFPSFAEWQAATQAHQATVLRHHVEALRRLKYRPTAGFCQLLLADGHPAVSWAVLDHERVPKAGYHALQAACAPVIVTADRPDATYRPGAAVALDVHVVSDLRHPLTDCVVRAHLAWPGGSHRWGFTGDVAADEVARVGTLSFVVPDVPGSLTLDLRLEGPVQATATYTSEIVPAGSGKVRLGRATAVRFGP